MRNISLNTGRRAAGFLLLFLIAGTAAAQSDKPWDGVYAGANLGGARSAACNSGTLQGTSVDPAIATAFFNPVCPANNSFVGGAQVGDNFQFKHLIFGVEADLDTWSAKNHSQTMVFTGASPPPGTYTFSGKLNPSLLAMIGPRIGFVSLQWMTYVTAGAILTSGSKDSSLSYTPPLAKAATASFSGGKSAASTGWAGGAGVEYGLNGPWSIRAEFLYADFGKGSNDTSTCSGTALACAAFSGVSFDSVHERLTAHMYRIGVNYWFGYW